MRAFQACRQEMGKLLFQALSVVGLLLPLAGCATSPRQLPPRAAPERQVPPVALPPSPPAEGEGRVVLGTTDGPMRVTAKQLRRFPTNNEIPPFRAGELCVTPCAVDLPTGTYKLYLSAAQAGEAASGDVDTLEVAPGTQVYLRAPGHFSTPKQADYVGPAVLLTLSMLAVAPGVLLVASGKSEMQAAGAVVMGLSVAGVIGGGVWFYGASRGEIQEGASTSYPLK